MKLFASALLGCLSLAQAAFAHEFWVEPNRFFVDKGDEVELDLRVGQLLEGASYPYLSKKFLRYDTTVAGDRVVIDGREGDLPSLTWTADREGLNIFSYHALPEYLNYTSFSDFETFLAEEGLSDIVDRHKARGLPEAGFTEGYSRNSKALVQVGPVLDGQIDEYTGMPFEFVALANPYAGPETLDVQLLWDDEPLADWQVAIFHRSIEGSVSRSLVRTGAEGIATIPTPKAGFFLLSAVRLDERDPTSGEAWHSTWAAMSFAIPLRGGETY